MTHTHGGRSSRHLIDAAALLAEAGLGPGEVVLDAGSGDGHVSVAASRIVGPEGMVYALDVHEESLERLRAEISVGGIANLQTMAVDLTAPSGVPIPDGSVDLCVLVNVLHGFVVNGEDARALPALARALKRGGRLLVVEFDKPADEAAGRGSARPSGPPHAHRISEEQTRSAVVRWGFDELRGFRGGPQHYALLFSKR